MRHCAQLFFPLLLLATGAAAHAQVAAYVTFTPIHAAGVQTGSVYTAGAGYVEQTTSFWAAGIGGGVTLNLLYIGPAVLALDLRGSTRPGTNGIDTGLAGVKLGFNPPGPSTQALRPGLGRLRRHPVPQRLHRRPPGSYRRQSVRRL